MAVNEFTTNADVLFPEQPNAGTLTVSERELRPEVLETMSEAFGRAGPSLTFKGEPADMALRLEIGTKIRRERLKQGLTQSELAKAVRISQAMLSNIETGKGSEGPTLKTLQSVTGALDLRVALLPDDDGKEFSEVLSSEVSIVKPSNKVASQVHVTSLGEDGVSFVRGLISKDDLKRISASLAQMKSFAKTWAARERSSACLWSLEPHSGTVFPAGNLVVLVVHDTEGIKLIDATFGKKVKVLSRDLTGLRAASAVELVGAGSDTMISNWGTGKSMIFSVPAEDLVAQIMAG